ncbi:hypothetical protein FOA52_011671 [Chlamydomonas sp. UWO 241]|nr:hypothetical protein FOA52_011671 [Chlamydomonas sp. UWO 241]
MQQRQQQQQQRKRGASPSESQELWAIINNEQPRGSGGKQQQQQQRGPADRRDGRTGAAAAPEEGGGGCSPSCSPRVEAAAAAARPRRRSHAAVSPAVPSDVSPLLATTTRASAGGAGGSGSGAPRGQGQQARCSSKTPGSPAAGDAARGAAPTTGSAVKGTGARGGARPSPAPRPAFLDDGDPDAHLFEGFDWLHKLGGPAREAGAAAAAAQPAGEGSGARGGGGGGGSNAAAAGAARAARTPSQQDDAGGSSSGGGRGAMSPPPARVPSPLRKQQGRPPVRAAAAGSRLGGASPSASGGGWSAGDDGGGGGDDGDDGDYFPADGGPVARGGGGGGYGSGYGGGFSGGSGLYSGGGGGEAQSDSGATGGGTGAAGAGAGAGAGLGSQGTECTQATHASKDGTQGGTQRGGKRKTPAEREAEAAEKERAKEAKKRKVLEDRAAKAAATAAEKQAKKTEAVVKRALRGTDGEARIRVKFSVGAATAPWYGTALAAINDWFGSLPGVKGVAAPQQCVEVPVSPPLPLHDLACVRWARAMPREAVEKLEVSQGGDDFQPSQSQGGVGGGGGDVEVWVPLVLVVLGAEEFATQNTLRTLSLSVLTPDHCSACLSGQVAADRLKGLAGRAWRHHSDCTLMVATFGLQQHLAKKQKTTPGFIAEAVNDALLDLAVAPESAALHLRHDIKDLEHLARFVAELTKCVGRDVNARAKGGGYLNNFCRLAPGLEGVMPLDKGYTEGHRVFARALMQNNTLERDKAAGVAHRFGNLGGLLDAFSSAEASSGARAAHKLLVCPAGSLRGGGGKTIGEASSKVVFELLARKDPEEVVARSAD